MGPDATLYKVKLEQNNLVPDAWSQGGGGNWLVLPMALGPPALCVFGLREEEALLMLPSFGGSGMEQESGLWAPLSQHVLPLQDGACDGDQAEPWARCAVFTLR